MRKFYMVLLVMLTTILFGGTAATALEVTPEYFGNIVDITISRTPTGGLHKIDYPVSSTGATSGTRYRTTEITFAIDTDSSQYRGSINAQNLVKVQPESGKTIKSLITITSDDIMQALGVPADKVAQVQDFFINNPNTLRLGAVIEIFNAGTDAVLDTIYSENEISSIAGKHGFGPGDIDDMHSRFIGGGAPLPPAEPEETSDPEPIPGGGLHFQATSQRNAIVGQTIDPLREPDTARWTDTVTATFTPVEVVKKVNKEFLRGEGVIAPPAAPKHGCNPAKNYNILDKWSLTGGTLKYPRQNPEFTFGDPLPPVGVTANNSGKVIPLSKLPEGCQTITMTPDATGMKLTGKFEEMWALNGAFIHDILNPELDEWIQTPQTYAITLSGVSVIVDYTEVVYQWVMVADGWDCIPVSESKKDIYYLGNVTGNLLIDGTGVVSIGM